MYDWKGELLAALKIAFDCIQDAVARLDDDAHETTEGQDADEVLNQIEALIEQMGGTI